MDVEGLRGTGWQPLPFAQFIVKIHSRCNLACDYCYVYEMADQSWRGQPKTMSDQVFTEACRIIGEHARRFALPAVSLVFHGGEPLLVGHETLERFARHARQTLEPITEVRLGMQTNGVLLDTEFLRICDRWGIQIGVSLDGDRGANDRHRKYRRGTGSYDDVAKGLELLGRDHRHLYSGLLCTIDVANDPIETYEALVHFGPLDIDFLLPHGNWTTPPPAKVADIAATPYADWLIAIFDRWYGAPELETRVRLFDEVIELLLGGQGASESVGLAPIQVAVIETDGTLEQVDALKSAFAGAAEIRPADHGNPLDEALWEPAVVARQIGVEALSDTCRACPVHKVCGAGHYAHRYRDGMGFRNPSVYCGDLERLIRHIETRVRADITAATGR
ncbi:FxsB family radical SAM/SPASM domain protein [Nocardia sp. NBC_00508]|uniref:FxsB family cyclophane-forming radical SAM/SPASM peptide maturase n=1 Tax=Nocardia sp. NBC_00508 TaxID=2975992 RepID=UPI002E801C37|nr:FxsB family cyclophane-forming radical SAM/SPASM peptide maturase [Nocardia sp. NBC_00508]WUD69155.1 FxsB family radical SAM/SPASM domain protein [Nocardia sp. NBC_00508]